MDGDRIGISIGCWLPWVILPGGLHLAAEGTRQTGCTFWQMLPLRNVTARALESVRIPVRFVEPAWNPTTLRDRLRNKPGTEGVPTKWQDVAFFPNPTTCNKRVAEILQTFPEAQLIAHEIMPNSYTRWTYLVEVHPELGMTSANLTISTTGPLWTAVLLSGKPYVLDTKHLRRPARGGEPSPLGPWQKALEVLLPYTALVHVQPLDGEELIRSLNGEVTELVQILMYLKGRYAGPFVIEVPPNLLGPTYFLNPSRMVSVLSGVRELIEQTAL